LVTEFLLGNVYFFLAGALALSMRRAPGVLAVPVLTKIAPAVVGVWFIVRGEWRSVLGAVAGTLVIVAPSVALAPQAWASWLAFLSSSARDGGIGASLRLLGALVLVVYAGRCSRAWLLAPATILACPVLGGYSPLAVCAAIPRLLEFSRDRRDEAASAELDDPFPLEPTER
jgi:hypothetical protein